MNKFKNLIFDVGEVIIHIDFMVTVKEFQKLGAKDFTEIVSYYKQHEIFDQFETGKISARQFRGELKQFLKPSVTDEEINAAWNSVLVDYPSDKFALLKELKPLYKTFALSNTNEIHVRTFNEEARRRFAGQDFNSFFHHAYYSNEVGFRKPDREIYDFIIQKENLNPAETFFVDDRPENIEAALGVGLQAYELKDRTKLHELLSNLNII